VTLTESQQRAMQQFLTVAHAISASLAADKLDDFNQAAGKLATVVPLLRAAFDTGHPWQSLVQQVETAAPLPQARSLEDARKSFYPFTAGAVEFGKAARKQSDAFAFLKIYKCPMAPKAGQTSFWLQLQGPLRNPFHGAEMPDCGSEVTP
jgi:hypothetical protein